MAPYTIGIDLGGTNIKAALVERNQGIVSATSAPTVAEEGPTEVLDRIAATIREVMAKVLPDEVGGIGIGAPGAVNWERTAVLYPPNLPGWDIVDLRDELGRRLETTGPILVENDANLAGLGSAFYGAGRPHTAFIMVTLGTGVGGAIIYNNTIFRGATGGAGEIGHMSIDYEGPFDRYGISGAIEAYIGQRFLSRHARYRLLSYSESRIHELAGEDLVNLTPLMLFQAAQDGDEGAREMLAWAGHKLGCVLASAVNLLDIRKVIVGGGVSAAGDLILEPARKTLNRYIMPSLRDGVEIIQETLGNEVGMLGAASLVFEYLDAHVSSPERL